MRIYGLDFTSAPSRRKSLIAVACALEGRVLRVEDAEVLGGFEGFEKMDFPFGQPRPLVGL